MKKTSSLTVPLKVVLCSVIFCVSCKDVREVKSDTPLLHVEDPISLDACDEKGTKAFLVDDDSDIKQIKVHVGCNTIEWPIVLIRRQWGGKSSTSLAINVEEVKNYTGDNSVKSNDLIALKKDFDPIEVIQVSLKLSKKEAIDNEFPDAVSVGLDTLPDIWSSSMTYLDARFSNKTGTLGKKELGLSQYDLDSFVKNSPSIKEMCGVLNEIDYHCDYKRISVHFPVFNNVGLTYQELNSLEDKGVPRSAYIIIPRA